VTNGSSLRVHLAVGFMMVTGVWNFGRGT